MTNFIQESITDRKPNAQSSQAGSYNKNENTHSIDNKTHLGFFSRDKSVQFTDQRLKDDLNYSDVNKRQFTMKKIKRQVNTPKEQISSPIYNLVNGVGRDNKTKISKDETISNKEGGSVEFSSNALKLQHTINNQLNLKMNQH